MEKILDFYIEDRILRLREKNACLVGLDFVDRIEYSDESSLLLQARREVEEYFQGNRREFSVKLNLVGSEFQIRVWKELMKIPYGETRSYKDIAEGINCPKGYRAVGLANNKNPIAIIVPCHRVVGSNGKLVGYSGGLDIKEKLLKIENDNLL